MGVGHLVSLSIMNQVVCCMLFRWSRRHSVPEVCGATSWTCNQCTKTGRGACGLPSLVLFPQRPAWRRWQLWLAGATSWPPHLCVSADLGGVAMFLLIHLSPVVAIFFIGCFKEVALIRAIDKPPWDFLYIENHLRTTTNLALWIIQS